jgi:hypothetical protein
MIQTQTAIDNGVALAIIKDGARIRVQSDLDALRASQASAPRPSSLMSSVAITLQQDLEKSRVENFKQRKALLEKEARNSELTLSNEALKILAQKYAKKIGLTENQLKADSDDAISSVVENSPELANNVMAEKLKTDMFK